MRTKNDQHIQAMLSIQSYKAGTIAYELNLDKKKFLIGQCESADLKIDHPHISHYHAFIIMDAAGGGTIIDLASENGCFINNEKVEKAFFSAGDVLRFGSLEFHVHEDELEKGVLEDQDSELVESLKPEELDSVESELPPLPGLTVIDGEYCDITFSESDFIPLKVLPTEQIELETESYIDLDEDRAEDPDRKVQPIARKSKQMAIEITTLSRGVVLNVDYFPYKKNTLYASAQNHGKKFVPISSLESPDDLPFINVTKDGLELLELPNFKVQKNGEEVTSNGTIPVEMDDFVILTKGTFQVMIRTTHAPSHIKPAPFFGPDRQFQKQSASVFGAIMGVMLLLLLVDTTVEPPEKKMAVIYREAVKAPEPVETKKANEVSEKEVDKGVKENEQKEAPTKMAKKSDTQEPQKPKAEPKPTPQKKQAKNAPKPAPKQASPQPKPTPKQAKAPPKPETKTKTYEFKSSAAMSSLLDSSDSKPQNVRSRAESSSSEGLQASAQKAAVSRSAATVGTMGEDSRGEYDTSTGAKGLASKRGIDTTYVDPKTVVLGSMDPELLRKILQEYLPQFRHCYQQELERRGDHIRGVIDLNFRIEKNGGVSRVDIQSKKTSLSGQCKSCMTKVLKMINFPKPKGGGIVDIKQPLNFQSETSRY